MVILTNFKEAGATWPSRYEAEPAHQQICRQVMRFGMHKPVCLVLGHCLDRNLTTCKGGNVHIQSEFCCLDRCRDITNVGDSV